METKSLKTEILTDIKELKDKGVNVIIYNEFIDRLGFVDNSFSMGVGSAVYLGSKNSCGCGGNCGCRKSKIALVKNPSDLTLEIYQNSTEDEISHNILMIKNELKASEEKRKSTAIVEFLRGELR